MWKAVVGSSLVECVDKLSILCVNTERGVTYFKTIMTESHSCIYSCTILVLNVVRFRAIFHFRVAWFRLFLLQTRTALTGTGTILLLHKLLVVAFYC